MLRKKSIPLSSDPLSVETATVESANSKNKLLENETPVEPRKKSEPEFKGKLVDQLKIIQAESTEILVKQISNSEPILNASPSAEIASTEEIFIIKRTGSQRSKSSGERLTPNTSVKRNSSLKREVVVDPIAGVKRTTSKKRAVEKSSLERL